MDVTHLNSDYADDIFGVAGSLFEYLNKFEGQDFYSPIIEAARALDVDVDMTNIKFNSTHELVQIAIDRLINVIEDVDYSTWPDSTERDFIIKCQRKMKRIRERYFEEFRSNHIWLFFNFYRPYMPFYFREPDGNYIVRDKYLIGGAIDFQSLALYFMVS